MADRVKYFLLGLLFLVIAGVIAYDRWNAPPTERPLSASTEDGENAGRAASPATPPRIVPPPVVIPTPVLPPVDPTPAPRPPAPEPEPKPEPARTQTYVVKRGDSLERIAMRFYKTRKGVAWIVEANDLTDPDNIRENQKLILPARAELKRAPKPQTPKPAVRTNETKIPARYTVRSGDGNLYAICRKFYGAKGEGARVARVMELNGLWSAEVKTGTVLQLPPK